MSAKHRLRNHLLVALLLLGTALSAASATVAGNTGTLRFEVFLDEEKIGTHSFSFEGSNDGVVMRSNASFDVKLLFLNAYRYRHQSTELWSDGCLSEIRSETDDNGKTHQVRGKSESGAFRFSSGNEQVVRDDCVMSFAYWDPRILKEAELINPQTGEVLDVTVVDKGRATFSVGNQEVRARQYRLTARGVDITIWYDGNNRWLGLESRVGDGNLLTYRPL